MKVRASNLDLLFVLAVVLLIIGPTLSDKCTLLMPPGQISVTFGSKNIPIDNGVGAFCSDSDGKNLSTLVKVSHVRMPNCIKDQNITIQNTVATLINTCYFPGPVVEDILITVQAWTSLEDQKQYIRSTVHVKVGDRPKYQTNIRHIFILAFFILLSMS